MVRSSRVSPLDIQVEKRPTDIFIPHLAKPTHYLFLFYLHFLSRRWGKETGNRHENPAAVWLYVPCFTGSQGIYHISLLHCLLWLTLIIKVYNHYPLKYITFSAVFTSPQLLDRSYETSDWHFFVFLFGEVFCCFHSLLYYNKNESQIKANGYLEFVAYRHFRDVLVLCEWNFLTLSHL